MLDRRIGKVSGKRVPVDPCEEVEALYRTRYQGFTARHFHEHLVRDCLELQLDEKRSCKTAICWRRRRGAVRTGTHGRVVRCRV